MKIDLYTIPHYCKNRRIQYLLFKEWIKWLEIQPVGKNVYRTKDLDRAYKILKQAKEMEEKNEE